ncbi:MAG: N-glycosylase/DNA lyase [Candidatus Micrarchaeota archaeon]
MQDLLDRILCLKQNPQVSEQVNHCISLFEDLHYKGNELWFSELCFCILTANSKAQTAMNIQAQLGYSGFVSLTEHELAKTIKEHKHRFHNTKAKYIVHARKFHNIKDVLPNNEFNAREWLVMNVTGLGMKESSHFLRNVGYANVAILDRHILKVLLESGSIDSIPNLSPKNYLRLEKLLSDLCIQTNLSQAELDLYLWYMKTGKILK